MALDRNRIVAAAVALADRNGVDRVTMRGVGEALGVEAMSLYHHVANKDALLDGMVDAVFAEVALPQGDDWREALCRRSADLRTVLARHPWAIGLLESRAAPGPATLRHLDAVIGCLRSAGFSTELTAHAYAALDAYVYGFALQEAQLPFSGPEETEALARELAADLDPEAVPHLAAFTADHVLQPGYDFSAEFDWGLDLVLDGLSAALAAE